MQTKTEILKQYFGYAEFREGQEQLIDNILSGGDSVGIMPTGAGKSLCFQIPALMHSGITLVISPLISLMKDQVHALTQNGIKAAFLNSSLTPRQYETALQNAANGLYKIIYVAPERLQTSDFMWFCTQAEISMVTVDEAHCVSQWGQDFRPSYLEIPAFLRQLPRRPIVCAFTATATPRVRQDITTLLELKDPFVVLTGFDRKNLCFEVARPKKKKAALLALLEEVKDKSGIIYCSTRKNVEQVCEQLQAAGYQATRYHAGLSDRERHEGQDDFLYDRCPIMVATNAFGMGIDKSNVSFVIHYNMPGDLESYYQEAGRAGRDGSSARCILLYSGADVMTQKFLLQHSEENSNLTPEQQAQIYAQGLRRLKEMADYCNTGDCLRGFILRYFGESAPTSCGNCSNCKSDFETIDITIPAQKILSCVARTNQRYGIQAIADTLRGKDTEKIRRFGLQKQSTYGLLADMSYDLLRDVIGFLVRESYLMVSEGEYPLLQLGARANEVLRERVPLTMKQPQRRARTKKEIERTPSFAQPDLLAKLKKLRAELAEKQSVPAYIIFSNAVLEDMCQKLPLTSYDFLQVSGVGNQKLALYGDAFLSVIRTHIEEEETA